MKSVLQNKVNLRGKGVGLVAFATAVIVGLAAVLSGFVFIGLPNQKSNAAELSSGWLDRSFTMTTFTKSDWTNRSDEYDPFSADDVATLSISTDGQSSGFIDEFSSKINIRINTGGKGHESKIGTSNRWINRSPQNTADTFHMSGSTNYSLGSGEHTGVLVIRGANNNLSNLRNVFQKSYSSFELETFSAAGFYQVSIYFETYREGSSFMGIGGDWKWHRLDYSFYVIPTHDDYGQLNTIRVLDNYGGDIPKNGISLSGGSVYFNGLDYMSVHYRRYDVGASLASIDTWIGDRYGIWGAGRHEFTVYRGDFFQESFVIYIESSIPSGTFVNNIVGSNSSMTIAKGQTTFEFDAGGRTTAPKVCRVYDNNTGALLAENRTGTINFAEGNYKLVLSYDGPLAAGDFPTATYYLTVEPNIEPQTNYNALRGNRFNNVKTRWYDVLNYETGDIMSFADYEKAFKYAMTVEYEKLCAEMGKETVDALLEDLESGLLLTEQMNINAAANTKLTYFDLNDTTERVFDNDTMFDNSRLWLDDDFQFVTEGPYDSYVVEYENLETGVTGTIPYFTAMRDVSLPNGVYKITERDIISNTNEYTVYRDTLVPVVEIKLDETLVTVVDGANYTCNYFTIQSLTDLDDWAVLKINDDYYLASEIIAGEVPELIYKNGMYEICAYDRNGNITAFTITVDGSEFPPEIVLGGGESAIKIAMIGAKPKCKVARDVTIVLCDSDCEIDIIFRINGFNVVPPIINDNEINLVATGIETHYYIRLTNAQDSEDYLEIFLILV